MWNRGIIYLSIKREINLTRNVSEKFYNNPLIKNENAGESHLEEVVLDPYQITLDRVCRSLSVLCADIDSEDDQVKLIYSKLQHAISSLKNKPGSDSELLDKLKLLVITFLDLARIDRMALYTDKDKEDIAKQSYGREDEDLSKVYVTGPIAEKRILNQDNFLDWINGVEDKKLDEFFAHDGYINNQPEHDLANDPEDVGELVNEIISLLECLESNRYDRYYRRKAQVALSAGNLDLDRFTERHREHYRHFFTNREGVSPNEVILTNSGARANEAVLNTLIKSGCSKVFIQEGWYYENIKTAKTYMDESPIEKADVFLLNADSSQPIDDVHYQSVFNQNLSLIANRAANEPEKTFYLVVDSTCDLLKLEDWHIPENVTLIKTYSATKHQRGGHNYFFGGVAVYGSDKLAKDIDDVVVNNGANIDGLSALHYPRLRQTEIRENTENIHQLNKVFKERLASAQSNIPPALRIQCHSYNYYSYLQFPVIMNHMSDSTKELGVLINNLFSKEVSGELSYETGDSFGLDETRLCNIGGKFFRCIRFSPGSNSNVKQINKLADYVGSMWSSLVTKIILDKNTNLFGETWHGNREKYLAVSKDFINNLESLFQQILAKPLDESNIQKMSDLLHPANPDNVFLGDEGHSLVDNYQTITGALISLLNDINRLPSDVWSRSMSDEIYFRLEAVKDIVDQTLAIYDATVNKTT